MIFICFIIGRNSLLCKEVIVPIKEMFRVDYIEIEGNRKDEAEAIIEKLATRLNIMLDNYLLRKDLSRIYEMKYFEEVDAFHKVSGDKNVLLFRLVEKPII